MIKCLVSNFSMIIENKKFINTIKDEFHNYKRILFVPSTPKNKTITEKNIKEIVNLFEEHGFNFSGIDYLEEYSERTKMDQYSVIFLMGGDTLQQNKFISTVELNDIFNDYKGIVIGLSAGALNMCKQTLVTPIHEEENNESLILRGLGLIDITVEVHFDINNEIMMELFNEICLRVYCIPDDSAIIVKDDVISIYGDVYLYDNEKFQKLEEKSFA